MFFRAERRDSARLSRSRSVIIMVKRRFDCARLTLAPLSAEVYEELWVSLPD